MSGDLNGDGVADLVVGAPGMLNRGCIYIFMGGQEVKLFLKVIRKFF